MEEHLILRYAANRSDPMNNLCRKLEELSMNAWPALQTVLKDGWVLRFSDGYTKRGNSVNPIYPSAECMDEVQFLRKIGVCEKYFTERLLNPVFKMTAVAPGHLEPILNNEGYQTIDHTSVQVLPLRNPFDSVDRGVTISTEFSEAWLEDYTRLNMVNDFNRAILRRILQQIVPVHGFISLLETDRVVACGMGVIEDGWIGLFDIVVDSRYRQCGYGERLIRNLLKFGLNNGAHQAYLQVVKNNIPALKLYEKLGFVEDYSYWYRMKRMSG
jgi:ribosomal protein S18 acetylase RimI-like enzyme